MKSGIQAKQCKSFKSKTFEHTAIIIQNGKSNIKLITVYRSEPTKQNRYSMSEFFDEFTEFLSQHITFNGTLLITGDFNIHVNKTHDRYAKQLNEILHMFDLKQQVHKPTHYKGNTLDLLITNKDLAILNLEIKDLNSDHSGILFRMNIPKPKPSTTFRKYRDTKNININKFKEDLKDILGFTKRVNPDINYLEKLIDTLDKTATIFNTHAPIQSTLITDRKPNPFKTADVKKSKTEKRKAEKR